MRILNKLKEVINNLLESTNRNNEISYDKDVYILLKAMVNAAKSDGKVDELEQKRIMEFMGDMTGMQKLFISQELKMPLNVKAFLEEIPADANSLKEAVENKSYLLTYQIAHKMKPTIDMFELGVLQDLIEVQDWGKLEQTEKDISEKLNIVLSAINNASNEMKSDFKL